MTTLNLNNLTDDVKPLTNDELVEVVRVVTMELHSRAGGATTTAVSKSLSNRDITIETAKQVIHNHEGKTYVAKNKVCKVEFIVNKDKRTVVALFRGVVTKKIWARGFSKCDPNDVFNVHIGKAIALLRGIGESVPAEILESPKPTEIKVGDRINWYGFKNKMANYIITSVDKTEIEGKCLYGFKQLDQEWQGEVSYKTAELLEKLVDDSRE